MIEALEILVRPMLMIAAIAYLGLAVRVARSSPQHANSVIAFIFLLVGALVAGSAFSYGTIDPNMYGIGRVLSFFASGFLPVAFYVVYREYTVGEPSAFFIALLSVIPIATTLGLSVPLLLGAAISGAIFGDHASPISDTTVVASMASATDHIDHVRTQLPYALTAGGIAATTFYLFGLF